MKDAAFWDGIAERYFRRPIDDEAAYADTLAMVTDRLTPGDRLLEVGCGTGGTAVRLAPHVAQVVATDFAPAMIGLAKGRLRENDPGNFVFRQAAAEAAQPEAPFDAACAFSLLHLVEDMDATLRTLRGQLREGGLLFSKTICLAEMSRALRLVLPLMRLVGKAPRVRFLTGVEIEAALERTGFRVEERRAYGRSERTRAYVARAV